MPRYTPRTEMMLAAIDQQLAGAPLPERAKYSLHGLSVEQLRQVKDFILSFDPHYVTDAADQRFDHVSKEQH